MKASGSPANGQNKAGPTGPADDEQQAGGGSPDDRGRITLSPFYYSAVNAVTEPNRLVFCSRYLVLNWSPLLGGTGLQILLFLRAHCFHDRRTGECRNHYQVSRSEIAQAVGVSEATVKREISQNETLRRFVQPQQEYRLSGGHGGVRRDANSYLVAMDDPVREKDWPRVAAYVRQAEAQREKGWDPGDATAAKRRARAEADQAGKAAGRRDGPEEGASGQFDPTPADTTSPGKTPGTAPPLGVKLTQVSGQFDPTESEEDSQRETHESTLNVNGRVNSVGDGRGRSDGPPTVRNVFAQELEREARALVDELRDWGSERRHVQLLSVCAQHELSDLSRQALQATRQRLAKEGKRGILEKPGAYYQRVLVSLLEGHQVFVPNANEDDPDEVRQIVRRSMGLTE